MILKTDEDVFFFQCWKSSALDIKLSNNVDTLVLRLTTWYFCGAFKIFRLRERLMFLNVNVFILSVIAFHWLISIKCSDRCVWPHLFNERIIFSRGTRLYYWITEVYQSRTWCFKSNEAKWFRVMIWVDVVSQQWIINNKTAYYYTNTASKLSLEKHLWTHKFYFICSDATVRLFLFIPKTIIFSQERQTKENEPL